MTTTLLEAEPGRRPGDVEVLWVEVGREGITVAAVTLPVALDDKVGLVVVPNPSSRPVKPAPYPNSSVVGGFAADEGPAGSVECN